MDASRPPFFGAAPGARKVVLSRAARVLFHLSKKKDFETQAVILEEGRAIQQSKIGKRSERPTTDSGAHLIVEQNHADKDKKKLGRPTTESGAHLIVDKNHADKC